VIHNRQIEIRAVYAVTSVEVVLLNMSARRFGEETSIRSRIMIFDVDLQLFDRTLIFCDFLKF
jgi:hypothetical protein